jgi:hypothetical protein
MQMPLEYHPAEKPSTALSITLFFSLGTLLLFYIFNHYVYFDQSGDGFVALHNYH